MVTCDTGATISVISLGIIQCYKLQVQDTSEYHLITDGNPMTCRNNSADKVIQDLLDAGIIVPVQEPTEWGPTD